METTWSEFNWQNNNFKTRQLISFFVSVVITLLLLLIPYQQDFSFPKDEVSLAVQLLKTMPETTEPEIVKQDLLKPDPVPVVAETPKPIQKTITATIQTTQQKPIKEKNTLPNVGVILNSMQGTQKLFKVDKDFQAATGDPNDFKFKQIIKPESKPLFILDNDKLGVDVTNYTPVAMKVLKGVAGYLSLAPIDDVVKTRGSLNYCQTLGRMAHYCPTSNPLVD
ncbi:MAG: hypothetical protein JKY19_14645 [Alcanivoracaceae bacterium]|nr:hypothetical protein [Alcanivoracaceae bacterium]